MFPRLFCQFAEHVKLEKLRAVVGVVDRARAHTVAERQRHVVFRHEVADFVEVGVEEALLVVDYAPFCHDASTARHASRQTAAHEFGMLAQHTGMDCEVVHSLLTLLHERVAVDFPRQLRHVSVHLLKRLIDGHRSHRHGAVAHNPFTRFVDVFSCREVHQRVAAPIAAPYRLVDLLFDA